MVHKKVQDSKIILWTQFRSLKKAAEVYVVCSVYMVQSPPGNAFLHQLPNHILLSIYYGSYLVYTTW
jgi:hypothetical protein